MASKIWVCFCGSETFSIFRLDAKRRVTKALCLFCKRTLLFTKHGMIDVSQSKLKAVK